MYYLLDCKNKYVGREILNTYCDSLKDIYDYEYHVLIFYIDHFKKPILSLTYRTLLTKKNRHSSELSVKDFIILLKDNLHQHLPTARQVIQYN